MSGLAVLLDGLDDHERVRGRGFERLCKWVLQNEPEYTARLDRVWLWDEWPGRWSADAGIDLVARDRGGGLWAVQAKHYGAAYAIKKADLDSFLSESSRPEFTYRLLIASTDHLGATARRTLDGQEKPVGTLLRSGLLALELPWPRSFSDLHPARLRRKKPLPHQRRAVRDVVAGLAERERGQLVMACGTGKTLAARFLHDAVASKRTLVLVPSLSLVKQTIREWFTVGAFDYLAVCSDDTVAMQDRDAVVATTSELGLPVTTDPAEIASFLRGRGGRTRVVFATYQSSQRIADAQAGRTPTFDLVIADEAHRCAGPEAGVFATVLDGTKIKARKRLFMTATPRYYTGRLRKEAAEADWEIASMDDEQKFGPILHRLTFAEAIDQGLLSDYQVVVVGVSDSSYRAMAERAAFVTLDGETVTDARTLASQLGLLRAMRKRNLRRVVTFHSRIRSAREFARSLPEVSQWMPPRRRPDGALWTRHVSGEMTSGEREASLTQLREVGSDERGLLTNARCLTEGVDVPTLDGVAFIEPRRSQVDIVQAVGRAMRKADDKAVGTIIIPVFVDENADAEQALDSSEFDRVWQVVKALRAHDDALADELDGLRRELGRRNTSGQLPAKILLDFPAVVSLDFARAFDTKLVETTTPNWEFWYGLLERFAARENHVRVLQTHTERGYQLGAWTSIQRAAFRKGQLSPERTARLEALPGWDWYPIEAAWETGFSRLESFASREHHARVPDEQMEDGYRLGQWVGVQRAAYRQGRLARGRIARLNALPGWEWSPVEALWEDGLTYLERFADREHHSRVPVSHVEDGYRLGQWVAGQRNAFREGRLSPGRVARLQALPGWVWSTQSAAWEEGFSYLERFVARECHADVPGKHVEDGYRLGQWAGVQRSKYRQGELSPGRMTRLEALPGWEWDRRRDAAWEEGLSHLEGFAAREGHTRVPRGHVEDGHRLGAWVTKQRSGYRKGRLSRTRVATLEALPGWVWDPHDADWEAGLSALTRFVTREHHGRVPVSHLEDDFKLGRWVNGQRNAFREGRLSPGRVARLEALPGWAWDALDAVWEESFVCLLRFASREGHARVPVSHREDGYRLGQWVKVQRRAHRAGKLSADRTARLEALPNWTWAAGKLGSVRPPSRRLRPPLTVPDSP